MLIPVQVTFRNMESIPALEKLIRQEAEKLERFYNRVSSCRVVIERPQKAPSSKVYHVRIDLGVPQGELLVKHAPTLHGTLRDTEVDRSRCEASAVLLHKTPQRAVREAFAEMTRQIQDYRRRQEGAVKTLNRTEKGIVSELLPAEGYGFLETAGGRKLYFGAGSVLNDHFGRLRVGSAVSFAEEMGEKGPQASTVKLIRARKQAASASAAVPLGRRRKAARAKS